MSSAVDLRYALKFIKLLTEPWEKTKAYELGVIDEKGKLLKKPSSFGQKDAYNVFHRLVFNIKRLLEKVPLVGRRLSKYQIAAVFLLKEHLGLEEAEMRVLLEDYLDVDAGRTALEEESAAGFYPAGRYQLAREILSPLTGETAGRRGDVVLLESEEPWDRLFGEDIYRVRLMETGERVYVARCDLQ